MRLPLADGDPAADFIADAAVQRNRVVAAKRPEGFGQVGSMTGHDHPNASCVPADKQYVFGQKMAFTVNFPDHQTRIC